MERLLRSNFKKYERTTAVWQNGGFCTKFNDRSSIEHLCKTEHFYFKIRHFANLQNVGGHCKGDTETDDINRKKGKNYTIQIGGLRADICNR
jgi:hypothetical protein